MAKETLTQLIDRVIGNTGLLRIQSWWMRKIFKLIISEFYSIRDNLSRLIKSSNDKINNIETTFNENINNVNNSLRQANNNITNLTKRVDDFQSFLPSITIECSGNSSTVGAISVDGLRYSLKSGENIVRYKRLVDLKKLGYYASIINLSFGDAWIPFTKSCREIFGRMNIKSIDLTGFKTSGITDFFRMFEYDDELTTIDVSSLDTSSATDMEYMFNGCYSLTNLDASNWDVSKVKNFGHMFNECYNIQSLNLSKWKPNQATDMKWMFGDCYRIEELDLSSFKEMLNLTSISGMFSGMQKLKKINLTEFHCPNVTSMDYLFKNCYELEELDLSSFGANKVNSINRIFARCRKLKRINFGTWDWSTIAYADEIFYGEGNDESVLTDVIGILSGIKVDLLFLWPAPLTADSAMVFINGLANTNKTKHISFRKCTYDSLTPEQIAIATAKGWTVVSAD